MMNSLIIGAVGSQIFSAIVLRYGFWVGMYYLSSVPYWSKFKKQSKEQMTNHATFVDHANSSVNADPDIRKLEARRNKYVYRDALPDYSLSDNRPSKMTLVLDSDNDGVSSNKFLTDLVERNALLPARATSELDDILETTERMQLVGFSMLYAGICPLATTLVFCNFLLDNYMMLYTNTHYVKRSIQQNSSSIGEWIYYLEVVTGIVTITNTFLLLVVSSSFREVLARIGF
jgi:hypothetical protein